MLMKLLVKLLTVTGQLVNGMLMKFQQCQVTLLVKLVLQPLQLMASQRIRQSPLATQLIVKQLISTMLMSQGRLSTQQLLMA